MSISFWPEIQQVTGGTSGSPASISSDGQWTIVLIDTSSNAYAELPSGANVGDLVEIHNTTGTASQVSPPAGESILSGSPISGKVFLRKVTSTEWSGIS